MTIRLVVGGNQVGHVVVACGLQPQRAHRTLNVRVRQGDGSRIRLHLIAPEGVVGGGDAAHRPGRGRGIDLSLQAGDLLAARGRPIAVNVVAQRLFLKVASATSILASRRSIIFSRPEF